MRQEKKRPSSFRQIALRVIALALCLWSLFMALLTWAVATDMYRQLRDKAEKYAYRVNHRESASIGGSEELPGVMEVNTIRGMGYPYLSLSLDQLFPFVLPQKPSSMGTDDWFWGKWEKVYGFDLAQVYYDENGQEILHNSTYLTFTYTSQQGWKSGDTAGLGRGYVDVDAIPGGVPDFRRYLFNSHPLHVFSNPSLLLLRMTGYFTGNAFHPTKIDRGNPPIFDKMQETPEYFHALDTQNRLEWETVLSLSPEEGRETQTIYAWDVVDTSSTSSPVTVGGKTFASLTELIRADTDYPFAYTSDSLLDAVILYRSRREDSYGAYSYALAVHCRPLEYAAARLWPTYLISAAAVALLVYLLLRKIRNSLTRPLENLTQAIARGTTLSPAAPWAEPYALEDHFAQSRKTLADSSAQLQQLRAALDYANNAEENRRQLISNITHELKTPLAVIHSYAEGLQADISREKTDAYLSVILEETERMDAMVLQMLDLSRLEAGKVRLASDAVSLLALTKSITEKLGPLLAEKELDLQFYPSEDFLINADEARIGQVLTNLVSNALKYTPKGGKIGIQIYTVSRKAHFDIENTCPPLPEEALQKIWDSFYRADPARTEPGTGLGLALVKRIVELHQGSCYVQNTEIRTEGTAETGVRFGFVLPMD